MGFNGLLQGVMQGVQGGADAGAYAAKGLYDDQRKIDVNKALADIEEEKILRIDEVKREREIADIPRKGAAETQVAVDRGNNKDFLKATRNVEQAKHIESAGSIAQAALANFQLDSQRTIQNLRTKLSDTTDPTERDALKQQISDLSTTSKGSFADVASVGNGYRMMAKEAREDARDLTGDEKASAIKRAQDFETMADAVFQSITDKKGVATPAARSTSATTTSTPGVDKGKSRPPLTSYRTNQNNQD